MNRKIIYQTVALVAAQAAVVPNGALLSQSPDVFAKPFQAFEQQYVALVQATSVGPQNNSAWRQQPYSVETFSVPFPVTEQQYVALVPAQTAGPNNTSVWRHQPLNPEVFAKPFPATDQQFITLLQPMPRYAISWGSVSPEVGFDTFVSEETALVPARASGTANTSVWRQQPLVPELFARPFAVGGQQYTAHIPLPNAPAAAISWGALSPEIVQDGVVVEHGTVWPVSPHTISAIPSQGWNTTLSHAFFTPKLLRWQIYFNLPFQQFNGWVDFWPQIAKPFPVYDQQYVAQTLPPLVTVGPTTPAQAWGGVSPELGFDTFVAEETALVPAVTAGVLNTAIWQQALNPEPFAKPFPIHDQQWVAFDPQQTPSPVFKEGWRGYQFEAALARPFPVGGQQFQTTLYGIVVTTFREGWRGAQWEYRFTQPFPSDDQQFAAYGRSLIPTVATPQGWQGFQLEARFAKAFPASEQQFQGWPPEFVPAVTSLPGAGKYPKIPPWVPQPPIGEKPQKPFRPVWDKPQGGKIEQPAKPLLPPAALFTPKPPPSDIFDPRVNPPTKLNLPDFTDLAPSNPAAFGQHMQDVQDQADMLKILKALGVIRDE